MRRHTSQRFAPPIDYTKIGLPKSRENQNICGMAKEHCVSFQQKWNRVRDLVRRKFQLHNWPVSQKGVGDGKIKG
jgi:hypothetical protein